MWAAGIVLYMMLLGSHPFEFKTKKSLAASAFSGLSPESDDEEED